MHFLHPALLALPTCLPPVPPLPMRCTSTPAVYYHPTLNPLGIPPPGKPQKWVPARAASNGCRSTCSIADAAAGGPAGREASRHCGGTPASSDRGVLALSSAGPTCVWCRYKSGGDSGSGAAGLPLPVPKQPPLPKGLPPPRPEGGWLGWFLRDACWLAQPCCFAGLLKLPPWRILVSGWHRLS